MEDLTISTIIDLASRGSIVLFLLLAIVAFLRGWIYNREAVTELRQQVKDLTEALKASSQANDRLADLWEAQNAANDRAGRV